MSTLDPLAILASEFGVKLSTYPDRVKTACRQLLGAEFGSNAWAESWDNLGAVLGMRESGG